MFLGTVTIQSHEQHARIPNVLMAKIVSMPCHVLECLYMMHSILQMSPLTSNRCLLRLVNMKNTYTKTCVMTKQFPQNSTEDIIFKEFTDPTTI